MALKINLEQLQAFCATATYGSFSAASRALGKSQSVISIQVMQLEEIFEYSLFVRGYKPHLTRRGELLFRHAESILRQVENFERHAASLQSSQNSVFRIGVDNSLYLCNFFDILSQWAKKYPFIEFAIERMQTSELVQSMKDQRVDMALCTSDRLYSDFNYIIIGKFQKQILVAKDHPLTKIVNLTLKDLQNFPHIVVESQIIKDDEKIVLSPSRHVVNNYFFGVNLVAKGMGFMVIPHNMLNIKTIFNDELTFLSSQRIPLGETVLSLVWQDGLDGCQGVKELIETIKNDLY